MPHFGPARGGDGFSSRTNRAHASAPVVHSTKTRGRFLCALAFVGILLVNCVISSSSEAGSSQNGLPREVHKALVFLNLYRDSRHVALIFQTLRPEYPELGKLSGAHDVLGTLKLKPVRSTTQRPGSDGFSAKIKGQEYSIPRKVGDQLVLQLTRFLIRHPKFETLFDRYVAKLQFAERVAIRALLIARTRTSLLSKDGRKFILEKIKDRP